MRPLSRVKAFLARNLDEEAKSFLYFIIILFMFVVYGII